MKTDKIGNDDRQPVILYADDDAICLEVGVKFLRTLGYKVLEARDGKETIEVFLNNQSEVNLVILDMRMPYNGGNAFFQLKKISANVKVLIASGYAKDEQIEEMMEQGCCGFIQKPFSINALSQKIMNILDDVAWNDFSAYDFLLEPEEIFTPIYIPILTAEEYLIAEVANAGGDPTELSLFLEKLKGSAISGLLDAWPRQKQEQLSSIHCVLHDRFYSRDGSDFILSEVTHTILYGVDVQQDLKCELKLSSILDSIFNLLTPIIIADLMESYSSSDFPEIPNQDIQAMYWNYVKEFFKHRFRPKGTGFMNVGETYELLDSGRLGPTLVLQEWQKLRDEIALEFPVVESDENADDSNLLDLLTVNSLYKHIEKSEQDIQPYPFIVFTPNSYNLGIRMVYRQEWRPLANQRGEVVKTIPLAPRQSIKYTTKILRRNKYSRKIDVQKSMETDVETMDTSKDSTDISNEIAKSFNWHVEAEASQSWTGGKARISGRLSGSKTENVKSNCNFLSESTKKMATKTRTETKVVVSTERDAEFESTESSEITNPNDEIAITYVFSELQKQYEILTRLAEAQDVVMIAEKLPEPIEIDYNWVKKYDWIIAKVLLDDSYKDALASISNDTESPTQSELGLVLLKLMGGAIGNLENLAKNSRNLSISDIDIAQEAQKGFREFNKEELARIKENQLIEIKRHRLYAPPMAT